MEALHFTNREKEIDEIHAHGYTPQETGDLLGIAWETVRKIICNIKPKKGYQKNTEMVAEYWCQKFGTSLAEQRAILQEKLEQGKAVAKKGANVIITFIVSSGLLFGTASEDRRNIRRPERARVNQMTRVTRTRKI